MVYHCPVDSCLYSEKGGRSFAKKNYLYQHKMKIHADKIHKCAKCNRKFSYLTDLKVHDRECGVEFSCACGKVYNTRAALLTHCYRTRHQLDDKFKSIKSKSSIEQARAAPEPTQTHGPINLIIQPPPIVYLLVNNPTMANSTNDMLGNAATKETGESCPSNLPKSQPRSIAPKSDPFSSLPARIVAAMALSELGSSISRASLGTQTDETTDCCHFARRAHMRRTEAQQQKRNFRSTRETQTGTVYCKKSKRPKLSVETQTALSNKHVKKVKMATKRNTSVSCDFAADVNKSSIQMQDPVMPSDFIHPGAIQQDGFPDLDGPCFNEYFNAELNPTCILSTSETQTEVGQFEKLIDLGADDIICYHMETQTSDELFDTNSFDYNQLGFGESAAGMVG